MEPPKSKRYIHYYDLSLEELKTIDSLPKKPTILMHVCCGPCSCFPLTFLCPHFDVTLYYENSNIYPEEEFKKRLATLKELLSDIKKDYGYEVKLAVAPYDHEGFMAPLRPYADCPERGERCWRCYQKRMAIAYDYAEENGFDYFTTVMTVSREKDSQILNYLGAQLEKGHPRTKYFYSDFKKHEGFEKGKQMRIRYGLYYQEYCGCEYSLANRLKQEKAKALSTSSESKNSSEK